LNIQLIRYIVQIIYFLLLFFTFFVSTQIFLLLTLFGTILGGAFYCGWFCPFGTMQEVVFNLKSFFFKKNIVIPYKYNKYFSILRYIFFGASFIGISIFFSIDARINFLDILSSNKLSLFSYFIIIFFLVSVFFKDRFFCNYFCIQGARYGLFSFLRIFRIKRNKKTCINCKICDNVCPMNIEISTKEQVNSIQCINCFKCISKCPKKNTLRYSLTNYQNIFKKVFK